MPRQSIFDMKFSNVFPLLIQKAERKSRTRAEVYEVRISRKGTRTMQRTRTGFCCSWKGSARPP